MPRAKLTKAQTRKPYPEFPLFLHATRQWAKKIRGKLHYFGTDPDAALAKYLDERDDLQAGRIPRPGREGLTVKDLANHFLTSKGNLLAAGEITERTFRDYVITCQRMADSLGKLTRVDDLTASDFESFRASLATTRGPVALAGEIQRVRTAFKYGFDSGLLDTPVRLGTGFKKPSKKVMRMAKNAGSPRLFDASEVRSILSAATSPLRAMTLLGMNCGFGQTDVASLPIDALDLDAGWCDFPRPKTAVPRRCPLWPETVRRHATRREGRGRRGPGIRHEVRGPLGPRTRQRD